jgi:hypothetical protein
VWADVSTPFARKIDLIVISGIIEYVHSEHGAVNIALAVMPGGIGFTGQSV